MVHCEFKGKRQGIFCSVLRIFFPFFSAPISDESSRCSSASSNVSDLNNFNSDPIGKWHFVLVNASIYV